MKKMMINGFYLVLFKWKSSFVTELFIKTLVSKVSFIQIPLL